jgi:mycothiol synthase
MRRLDLNNLPVPPPLPEGYLLRPLRPDDRLALTRLMRAAFPEMTWDEARTAQELEADPNVKCTFVVVCGEAIVATASALLEPEDHPGTGIIHWVAAHPAHQGKGLGLIVSLAILEEFVRLGCHDSLLRTDTHRVPAIKTYTKLGFSGGL